MPGGPRAGRREASQSAGAGVGVSRRQLAAQPAGGDLRARACGSLPSDGAGVGRGRSASCAFPAAVSAGPSRGRPSGKAEAARPAASGGSGLGSVRKAPSLEWPGPPAWPSREAPGPCSPQPPAWPSCRVPAPRGLPRVSPGQARCIKINSAATRPLTVPCTVLCLVVLVTPSTAPRP